MEKDSPRAVYRKDYKEPVYLIPDIELAVDLHDMGTLVRSTLTIVPAEGGSSADMPLKLNGEKLRLVKIELNSRELDPSEYELTDTTLTIHNIPGKCTLYIENEIDPVENRALEGLYKSGSIFCTQNEPEGFRRITWFIDRPDIMTRFTTTVIADRETCPVLLSNGNPVAGGDMENGRHWITWKDPFPKPSYLFALVAGDLGLVQDTFTTSGGRAIDLRIYCDRGNEGKCGHAMDSLKKAMKWDENRFGLEYDLDIYMIVAVDTFNMGAMENKGLNIFNSHYVLADPETATDSNYVGIEGVIGHEYFHNWTGNRITCRDWFQLTLKEGLTVFRDQEFTSDMQSRPVKRIDDVNAIRMGQFPEDSSLMAHPIRPDSYMEINNFYTSTVYQKGAEVIGMIHTLLGRDGFRSGMDRYIQLYDGRAVTCEDFLHAMELGGGVDLSQFRLWYSQAGTPVLKVSGSYNSGAGEYCLRVKQSIPDTPGQGNKKPMHMPLRAGLLDRDGRDMLTGTEGPGTVLCELREEEQEFVFKNINEKPVLSFNRNFSVPARIDTGQGMDELLFLFANDSDPFNRWDAGQRAARSLVKDLVADIHSGREMRADRDFKGAFEKILNDTGIDRQFCSQLLRLPDEQILVQDYDTPDFDAIRKARLFLKKEIAVHCLDSFQELYDFLEDQGDYHIDTASMGRRELRLVCLNYLVEGGHDGAVDACVAHFSTAGNMTDEFGALACLRDSDVPERKACLESFYNRWNADMLVMTKWLSLQALSSLPDTLEQVRRLETDRVFNNSIPNLVRALTGSFTRNLPLFHAQDGSGYRYTGERIIEIDTFNPSMASSLSGAFRLYPVVDEKRREEMRPVLEGILSQKGLSGNTYEIVYKTLSEDKQIEL